jgi:ferritin
MFNLKIQDALNEQINHEFYSSYLYLSMSAYFETLNLQGFAHWMRLQSTEEQVHAIKLFDFINDRNGRVILGAIEQPPTEFQSPLEVFQQAFKHEQQVTEMIDRLYKLAAVDKDYAIQVALQWFIEEQVGEEKLVRQIVDELKMIGDEGVALFILDRELGGRVAGE